MRTIKMAFRGLMFLLCASQPLFSQTRSAQLNNSSSQAVDPTLKGFVYDKSTGETLIGATVFLKNSKLGCATNDNGFFIIPNAPVGRDTLIVSYMGYEPNKREIVMDETWSKVLKIFLTPSAYRIGEVVVTGDSGTIADQVFKRPVSILTLTSKDVNSIPRVIEPDLLRALQNMPGITGLSDFSSAIYVRGGTPDQNLYFLDGAEIYNPEHGFGIFSTFNTNAIKEVKVSKGGFGAEYGDRLSSVIDVIDLDGNRNKFEGVFNASLIAADITLQVPVGSIGSVSGSFRRTYIDLTYAKWSKDIPDYYFYDGNMKGSFNLSDKDILTLSYFNGKDNLDYQLNQNVSQSPKLTYDWGNRLGSVNWKHIFSDKFFSSLYITASGFSSDFKMDQSMNMEEKNSLLDYTIREALEYYISNEVTLKTGAEHKRLHLAYRQEWDQGLIDFDERGAEFSGYVSPIWRPNPLWEIEAGLRFGQYKMDRTFTNLDPRLSIKYKLSETSSLKFATGIYHQYLTSIPRFILESIWMSDDRNIGDSRVAHFILGYNKQIGNQLSLETETYYKGYHNIYVYNQNVGADITPSYHTPDGKPVYSSSKDVLIGGSGESYGIEILLRKETGAVTGWISYALSRTSYVFDGINQGKSFVPRQDRTSVVNFVLNGNAGDIFNGRWNGSPTKSSSNWLLGLNLIFTTGQPMTVPSSSYYVNTLPDWNNYNPTNENLPSYKLYPGTIDTYRLPDYVRMDISLTWENNFKGWSLSPYLQIFNFGNRQNVWFITYSSKEVNGKVVQSVEPVNMLPILPTIGITARF